MVGHQVRSSQPWLLSSTCPRRVSEILNDCLIWIPSHLRFSSYYGYKTEFVKPPVTTVLMVPSRPSPRSTPPRLSRGILSVVDSIDDLWVPRSVYPVVHVLRFWVVSVSEPILTVSPLVVTHFCGLHCHTYPTCLSVTVRGPRTITNSRPSPRPRSFPSSRPSRSIRRPLGFLRP